MQKVEDAMTNSLERFAELLWPPKNTHAVFVVSNGDRFTSPAKDLTAMIPHDDWAETWTVALDNHTLYCKELRQETLHISNVQLLFQEAFNKFKLSNNKQGARFIVEINTPVDYDDLCVLLQASRSVNQTRTDYIHQMALVGKFNISSFKYMWIQHKRGSFPINDHNILCAGKHTEESISEFLYNKGHVTQPPSEEHLRCVKAIMDCTRGDRDLCEYACCHFANSIPFSDQEVYIALMGLPHQSDVDDLVVSRVAELNDTDNALLRDILRNQRRVVESDCIEAESLRLSGLVEVEPMRGKLVLSLSCACIEITLRKYVIPGFSNRPYAAPAEEMMPTVSTVDLCAFPLLFEIENLLRNLVCLELSAFGSNSDWIMKIEMKLEGQLLIDRIKEMKKAEESRKLLPSANNPIMSFLTTGELKDIILGKLYDKYFMRIFPNKGELQAHLDYFNQIRVMVAHNRAIPPETVARLKNIRADILLHIGSAR